ncbi:hypothetical protein BDR26DRAFT_800031 [Obelidium mucronatum]|nr:hypothetical protein BDR26DRAFT_800031 [Obelidium mucronatum]
MGVDDKGRPIIDVIDSMDEDPFTLDSFERMIRAHALKGKDFLIARVATVDPQDETRFYYSYYSAHHINKVLFRTQPEEGLLHRMKAKNPLNNMVIMGDVHYYSIKAISVNLALLTNRNLASADTSPADSHDLPSEPLAWNDERALSIIAQRLTAKVNRFLYGGNRKLHIIMKPDGLLTEEEAGIDATSRLEPNARQDGIESDSSDETSHAEGDTVLAHVEKFTAFLKEITGEPDVNYSDEFEILRERYQQEVEGKAMTPFSFSQRKVKSSSFINDYNRTHEYQSFEDWLKETALLAVSDSKQTDSPNDASTGSLTRLKLRRQHKDIDHGNAIKIESPVHSNENVGKLFYIAEYLASDDDFLMKSSVRSIFRENALESDDAVLFTLPSNSVSDAVPNGEQHPALRNFTFSVEENGWTITSKSFKLFLLAYFFISVAVIKFLIPGEYVYVSTVLEEKKKKRKRRMNNGITSQMASFSSVFFLCLFLIIVL